MHASGASQFAYVVTYVLVPLRSASGRNFFVSFHETYLPTCACLRAFSVRRSCKVSVWVLTVANRWRCGKNVNCRKRSLQLNYIVNIRIMSIV